LRFLVATIGCLLLAGPASVRAEIAVLANGMTIKTTASRLEGEMIFLTVAGGGELGLAAEDVVSLLPDEIVDEALSLPEDAEEPRALARLARKIAERHGVDPDLVAAVVSIESAFVPDAVSHKGAMGLMQLMPATAASLGVSDPYDPEQNLDGGVRHLQTLLERYSGNRLLALAAYNAGAAAVARHGGVPPFRETQEYVRKVLSRAGRSQ